MRSRSSFAVAALCAVVTLPATPTAAQSQGPRLTLTETLRLDANAEDFPSVNTAFTGPGGILLVRSSRGDQIATALVPPRSRLLEVSLGNILVSETDDDGLTSVVRYRVSGRGCGPPECS